MGKVRKHARARASLTATARRPQDALEAQDIKDMIVGKPLLQQIALVYYRFARGEQDIALADYILEQIRNLDIEEFYMNRLLDEAGITRKQWDRWSIIASNRIVKLEDHGVEIEEYENDWTSQMSALSGLSVDEIEEIDVVESTIGEIDIPTGPNFDFQRKIEAIDRVMHNFHAGIAPLEIVGADREELYRLAEFLKHADSRDLALIVDADDSPGVQTDTSIHYQSTIEGYTPSGRAIRPGD